MRKKGIAIWVFSTLTVISLIHLIDAAAALIFNFQIQLLKVYPYINQHQISANIYFLISGASTTILWAITCLIVFDNPIEAFLNKILSDAKQQTALEAEVLENRSELFDLMYETVESDSETLANITDLMRNIRAEVKDLRPVKEITEKTRIELGNLKRQIRILEEKILFTIVCSACGKLLRPDFKLCPYCGESITLHEKMMVVKDQK